MRVGTSLDSIAVKRYVIFTSKPATTIPYTAPAPHIIICQVADSETYDSANIIRAALCGGHFVRPY